MKAQKSNLEIFTNILKNSIEADANTIIPQARNASGRNEMIVHFQSNDNLQVVTNGISNDNLQVVTNGINY